MDVLNLVECAHCRGDGKCQCDECQKRQFGRTYRSSGHYATCSVCGGAGKVAVGSPSVECKHCKGTGKCQCDGCQEAGLGEARYFSGHYARCAACGGSGRARVRLVE